MRTVVGILGLCAGCELVFDRPVEPAAAGRVRVLSIVNPTNATLDDFPVRIAFDNDPQLAAGAAADGRDLAFFTPAGDELAAEVRYAPTGTLDAWVKIPSLPGKPAQATIELRYGTGSPRLAEPTAVWTAYAGVWHLDGTGPTESDSLGTLDVGAQGTATPSSAPGIAGTARVFDGVDDRMCANASQTFGAASFAYSVWILVDGMSANADRVMASGAGNANNPGFNFELGGDTWVANVSDGQGRTDMTSSLIVPLMVINGAWVNLAVRFDRTTNQMETYVDGFRVDRTTIPAAFGMVDATDPFCFGNVAEPFLGQLDEPRVYATAVPAEWLRAETANLSTPGDFVELISDEEISH